MDVYYMHLIRMRKTFQGYWIKIISVTLWPHKQIFKTILSFNLTCTKKVQFKNCLSFSTYIVYSSVSNKNLFLTHTHTCSNSQTLEFYNFWCKGNGVLDRWINFFRVTTFSRVEIRNKAPSLSSPSHISWFFSIWGSH